MLVFKLEEKPIRCSAVQMLKKTSFFQQCKMVRFTKIDDHRLLHRFTPLDTNS